MRVVGAARLQSSMTTVLLDAWDQLRIQIFSNKVGLPRSPSEKYPTQLRAFGV
jgi:hypothetical protein